MKDVRLDGQRAPTTVATQAAAATRVTTPVEDAAVSYRVTDDRFERDGATLLDLMSSALAPTSDSRVALRTWLEFLDELPSEASGAGVNTHSALIFLRRIGVCDGADLTKLDAALAKSWMRLTGHVPEKIDERLPRRVLFRASKDERDLHAAAFQADSRASSGSPLRDYTPQPQDAGYALSAVALALTETGADVLTGGVAGLLIATVGESLLHDIGGHPRAKMKAWSAKPGRLRQRFRQAALGHVGAHHRTFLGDYGKMFRSAEDKARVDARLEAAKALDPTLDTDIVREEQYGLTVANSQMLGFAQPYVAAATFAAVVGATLGFDLSTAGVLSLYATSVLPPFASKLLHPHLHKPRAEALQDASPVMRTLLESRIVELMDKLHFGHHRGRGGNFNLVTPIGDMIRGKLRLPTVKQLLEMRADEKWPRSEFGG